jgi:Flp pilus assembly protein TadD
VLFALPTFCQESGNREVGSFGHGAEITVTVHDASGQTIGSTATVKLVRGTMPSAQAQTIGGNALLVVDDIGDFTAVVDAPGYLEARKEVSVLANGRSQVDVYLTRLPNGTVTGVPGRPVLAPKAKEALDKGLIALGAEKFKDAAKYVGEAERLAPQHPDVLYVEGVLSLKQRNWTRAEESLERATQMDPTLAPAYAALGMALCDQGKYENAIVALEKSLELSAAGTWEARWALAKAYYERARYDQALTMSQEALSQSNGKMPEVALLVAQALTAVGRYEDSAQVLRAYLKDHGNERGAATAKRWLKGLAANGKIRDGRI